MNKILTTISRLFENNSFEHSVQYTQKLFKGIRLGLIFNASWCVMYAAALYPFVNQKTLLHWTTTALCVLLFRIAVLAPVIVPSKPRPMQLWRRLLAIFGIILNGLVWGSSAFLFIDGAGNANDLLTILLLTTVATIGAFNFWRLKYVGLIFFCTICIPIYIQIFSFELNKSLYYSFWVSSFITLSYFGFSRTFSIIRLYTEQQGENERIKASLEENKERLRKELSLKQENDLYKSLVENANGFSVLIHDLEDYGKIIYANNTALKQFGLNLESLQKLTPEYFDPSWGERAEDITNTLSKGESLHFESTHFSQDGSSIPVEISLHPYVYKGRNLCLSYTQDITVKRLLEEKTIEYKAALAKEGLEKQFQSMVEALPDKAVRLDAEMNFTYANQASIDATRQVFQIDPNAQIPNLFNSCIKDVPFPRTEFGDKLVQEIETSIRTKSPVNFDFWITEEKQRICLDVRITPELDASGTCVGVLALSRDITEKAIINETVRFLASNQWIENNQSLFESLVQFLCQILNVDTIVIETLKNDSELSTAAAFGKNSEDLPKSRPISQSICEKTKQKAGFLEFRNLKDTMPGDKFAEVLIADHVLCLPLTGQQGKTIGFFSAYNTTIINEPNLSKTVMQFVSGRLSAELESAKVSSLEKEREREFRSLVEQSPDYISRFDATGQCIYANPALKALFPEFDPESLDTKDAAVRVTGAIGAFKAIEKTIRSGTEQTSQDRVILGHEVLHIESRIVPEFDNEGSVIGALSIARDITQRIRLEEDLRRQATIDQLTNLPNRRLFTKLLAEQLNNTEEHKQSLALMFIDLDRFKEINDTLGHEIGDDLLIETSARLAEKIPQNGTLARLGGDEFVVLLPESDDTFLLNRADSILESLAQPYTLGTNQSYITASVGIARYPNDANTPAGLMSCADQAMYAAKQQGRNCYCFFTASMQEKADARVNLINELRCALEKQQFQVVYQPIIDVKTQSPTKAEALLRWHHPALGSISPAEFIPLAEETGLIVEIGDWVFQQVLDAVKAWKNIEANNDVQIAINISPRHFIQDGAIDSWLNWIKESGVSPQCISIEITENLLLGEFVDVQDDLNKLQSAGIQLALDDFGTGYSAMAYLKRFNIDYLKIDGSFVRDLEKDANDRAISETIAWMARRLGMKSVAECVETEEQKTMLEQFGCDYLQGYHFSKPLPLDEFCNFVLEYTEQHSKTAEPH